MKPVYRNPTAAEPVLGYREFLREHMPTGPEGFVAEDIDLLIRTYGKNYQSDATGRFLLCECKFGRNFPGIAQLKTFGLVDRLLRLADPERERYKGFYIIQYSDEDWNVAEFRVNGKNVTRALFLDFLNFQVEVEPYDLSKF